MNLKDLLRDGEYVKDDDWSAARHTFGDRGQVQVIGHLGARNGSRIYVLYCHICAQDPELFGEGYFWSTKYNLIKTKIIPCGCSKKMHWTKEQYSILCSRKAKELGFTFKGFDGEWLNRDTRVILHCEKHGDNTTSMISTLLLGAGCRYCGFEASAAAKIKPDSVMIESFFASGAFHPETKFWRSERKNTNGVKSYWHYLCGDCSKQGHSTSTSIQDGQKSCGCSVQRQQQAYINFVWDGDIVVALKFGVARKAKRRVAEQNSRAAYKITNHSIYEFHDVESCRYAEKQCKEKLECPVINRQYMQDGWSETTWVYNLEKIIWLYEASGGVKLK